jgi:hypothetical protein
MPASAVRNSDELDLGQVLDLEKNRLKSRAGT